MLSALAVPLRLEGGSHFIRLQTSELVSKSSDSKVPKGRISAGLLNRALACTRLSSNSTHRFRFCPSGQGSSNDFLSDFGSQLG
jgi:hypothetical protein